MTKHDREYPDVMRSQEDANKQAIVESIMGAYGLDQAEALEHYESGDWKGMNLTSAVQERKDDAKGGEYANRTVLSVPYDAEPKKAPETETLTNVPPGVDAPEVVVDDK